MLIPLIVACALFMENLDRPVWRPPCPRSPSLGENPLHLNLAITAYLFSLAVFIPVSGWVADRFGARHVFRAGHRHLRPRLDPVRPQQRRCRHFVLARILQGMGGAMMVPVGRLVSAARGPEVAISCARWPI